MKCFTIERIFTYIAEKRKKEREREIDVIILLYPQTAVSNSLPECNTKRLINEAHFISNPTIPSRRGDEEEWI